MNARVLRIRREMAPGTCASITQTTSLNVRLAHTRAGAPPPGVEKDDRVYERTCVCAGQGV